jgi:hypothetical protein
VPDHSVGRSSLPDPRPLDRAAVYGLDELLAHVQPQPPIEGLELRDHRVTRSAAGGTGNSGSYRASVHVVWRQGLALEAGCRSRRSRGLWALILLAWLRERAIGS